jgi:predicted nucleic acid-binding protein
VKKAIFDASYLIEYLEKADSNNFDWMDDATLYAPEILRYEYNNFFCRNIDEDKVQYLRDLIVSLDITYLSIAGKEESICSIAKKNKLSFYDASYLAMAVEKELPIATYDKEIIRVAENCGIEIIP